MDNPTRIRIRRNAEACEVMVLVRHPMHTDPIEMLALHCNGLAVAEIYAGENVADNPLFTVGMKRIEPGEAVEVSWHDTAGATGHASLVTT